MSVPLTVISGGQTGADIAALRAAKQCGLATGGVAPADYITANGRAPELGTEFGLQQLIRERASLAQMYVRRSMMNVDHSQATIAFRLQVSIGTDKTIGYCNDKVWRFARRTASGPVYRPCLVIDDVTDEVGAAQLIAEFIRTKNISVVNVCGHRDDRTAGIDQFETRVFRILSAAFQSLADQAMKTDEDDS